MLRVWGVCLLQEEARERRLKEQMEAEIREKDQQLQELMSVQSQVCRERDWCVGRETGV